VSNSLWNDPGILEALARGYRKILLERDDSLVGPGTKGHPEVGLVISDNGEQPSPGPGVKRSLTTPEDLQPPKKLRDRSHPTSRIGDVIAPHGRPVQQADANVLARQEPFAWTASVTRSNHGSLGLSCGTDQAREKVADSLVTPQTLDYTEISEAKSVESDETKSAKKDTAKFTSEEDPRDETEDREEPVEFPNGDLPGAAILAADIKLMNVYGNYIHQNDGMHLDGGGITNNIKWQE
jgi:hypothetical protein